MLQTCPNPTVLHAVRGWASRDHSASSPGHGMDVEGTGEVRGRLHPLTVWTRGSSAPPPAPCSLAPLPHISAAGQVTSPGSGPPWQIPQKQTLPAPQLPFPQPLGVTEACVMSPLPVDGPLPRARGFLMEGPTR